MPNKRILLVDDEPSILDALHEICTMEGYDCIKAKDGKLAWDILEMNQFDLMITNIKMPRISGFELLPMTRIKFPLMPVLIFSGIITDSQIEDLMQDGATSCIKKGASINLTHFLKKIETALYINQNN